MGLKPKKHFFGPHSLPDQRLQPSTVVRNHKQLHHPVVWSPHTTQTWGNTGRQRLAALAPVKAVQLVGGQAAQGSQASNRHGVRAPRRVVLYGFAGVRWLIAGLVAVEDLDCQLHEPGWSEWGKWHDDAE